MDCIKRFLVSIFLTIFVFQCTCETIDDFYTAGVVEFRPRIVGASSTDILQEHLTAYIELIHSNEANETDIIVFPEGTLNNLMHASVVPAPAVEVNLCLDSTGDEYEPFLKAISCAARDTAKYIVINIKERERCFEHQPCADNGWNIYNTNVVFDRSGRVVSRYRKWHVYLEPHINTTEVPEYAIFETDFGVTFGHIICFDILFHTPAQELVTKYGVHDIIFTSMFYSELPFLTATQLQQSWAWGNDVNLLAAGASYPQSGVTGSGIYSGAAGALIRKMAAGEGEREVLVARVPKSRNIRSQVNQNLDKKAHQTEIYLLKDPQLTNFTSELLDISLEKSQSIEKRLCHTGHCCTFNVATKPTDHGLLSNFYRYRIGVFKGERSYEQEEFSNLRICALYACTNDSVSSCGELFSTNDIGTPFVFTDITINGQFEQLDRMLIMPNTLDTELYSLNPDTIEWNVNHGGVATEVSIKLKVPQTELLTFGIYVNDYDNSSASHMDLFWLTSVYGCLLLYILLFFTN